MLSGVNEIRFWICAPGIYLQPLAWQIMDLDRKRFRDELFRASQYPVKIWRTLPFWWRIWGSITEKVKWLLSIFRCKFSPENGKKFWQHQEGTLNEMGLFLDWKRICTAALGVFFATINRPDQYKKSFSAGLKAKKLRGNTGYRILFYACLLNSCQFFPRNR